MLLRRAAAELRVASFGDSSIPPNSMSGLGGQGAGQFLTENGALAISTVLNCVKVLHDDVRVMPFLAYSGDKNGLKVKAAKQPPVVAAPFGPDLTLSAGLGQIVVSLALRGNAFLRVVQTDPHGFPLQLEILHPDRVQVKQIAGQKMFVMNGVADPIDGSKIKHITGTMLPGSLIGIDPVSYQRTTLMLAADLNQYGANFFRNGGLPSVVLKSKGSIDRKRAREIKDAYESGHAGVSNAHRPAVIGGDIDLTTLVQISPENAQFLATRAFMREEIAAWFGVPINRVGGEVKVQAKGMDSAEQQYAMHTLLPLISPIEEVWTSFLPGEQGTWVKFDFDEFLRVSALERAQIAQIYRVIGVRNRNELRADEGWLPTGPEGDNYDQPLNSNTSPAGGPDNGPGVGGQDNPGAAPGAVGDTGGTPK